MRANRFNLLWAGGMVGVSLFFSSFSFAEKGPSLEELVSQGNAFYTQNDFRKALEIYQEALLQAEDLSKAKVHYNLGNTYYHLGQLENALREFKEALRLNPNDENSKYNLEVVLRALEGKRFVLRDLPADVTANSKQDTLDEEIRLILQSLEEAEFRDPKGLPTPPPPPGEKTKPYKKDW
ncbi:MAG: tetratricopeptide repeat protein [Candidatus Omnitrophica bacterium]|nr:tetratricopeptide repeat protein [Candidatus Omnitrophota bacterium]